MKRKKKKPPKRRMGIKIIIIGIIGIIKNRWNWIKMIMCIEIMWIGCMWSMIEISPIIDEIKTDIATIIILSIGGTETGIGLGIIISTIRQKGTISIMSRNIIG